MIYGKSHLREEGLELKRLTSTNKKNEQFRVSIYLREVSVRCDLETVVRLASEE